MRQSKRIEIKVALAKAIQRLNKGDKDAQISIDFYNRKLSETKKK